jgi:hypothetical protein
MIGSAARASPTGITLRSRAGIGYLPWEREAIIAFARAYSLDGYRRLCYRMIDEGIAACAPSTVYRML